MAKIPTAPHTVSSFLKQNLDRGMSIDLVFSGMALRRGLDGDALLRDSELVECVVISDFFLIILFPIPFFISQSITAQGSGNLFGLNIVWNVITSMHILMIKLIPFYEDTTHLDIFTLECEETNLGVCALPIFKGKRRERRRSKCQEEE